MIDECVDRIFQTLGVQLDKGFRSVWGVSTRILELGEKVNFRTTREQLSYLLGEFERSRNETDEVRSPLYVLIKCVDREVYRRQLRIL